MLTIIASLIFSALSALSEVYTCFFLSQLSYAPPQSCLVIGEEKVFRLRAGSLLAASTYSGRGLLKCRPRY